LTSDNPLDGCPAGERTLAERPLDHATARIVAELAAALLPHLQETLAVELKSAVEALSIRTRHGVQEALSALELLKVASDEVTASLNAAETSIGEMSSGILPSLSRICERLGTFAVQPAAGNERLDATLGALKNAIANWEGVLKADGHAQTRELSEFSSELSELVRDMGVSLPQAVKDTTEKAMTSWDGEWVKTVLENRVVMEKRLARLEKIVVVFGAISAILLAVVVLILYK
jgi:hypothetical protein